MTGSVCVASPATCHLGDRRPRARASERVLRLVDEPVRRLTAPIPASLPSHDAIQGAPEAMPPSPRTSAAKRSLRRDLPDADADPSREGPRFRSAGRRTSRPAGGAPINGVRPSRAMESISMVVRRGRLALRRRRGRSTPRRQPHRHRESSVRQRYRQRHLRRWRRNRHRGEVRDTHRNPWGRPDTSGAMARRWHAGPRAHPCQHSRPGAAPGLSCWFGVEPPAGIEPATPSLPSMRRRVTTPSSTSPSRATAQVRSAIEGCAAGLGEVACGVVSGRSLARPSCGGVAPTPDRHRSDSP
jgi:hypothetical protein